MKNAHVCRRTPLLIAALSIGLRVLHAEPAADSREAALAKLRDNDVSLNGLSLAPDKGGPMVSLGIGRNGGAANNADDANMALLARLPEIERLYVNQGTFTHAGLASLTTLTNLHVLAFHAPKVETGVFTALAGLKSLRTLRFTEYSVTDDVLDAAGTLRGLKALEIGSFVNKSQRVTAAGVGRFLARVEGLEALVVLGAAVDDAAMARLGEMTSLKRLWLDSRQVTPQAWRHLATLTKMRDLYLRGTSFNDDGARALAGMKDLEVLMLDDTAITDAGMASLAGLVKLADLGLANTKVTDTGIAHLGAMAKLHNLYVVGTGVTAKGLAVLPAKSGMSMMRIGNRPLTADEFVGLEKMFPRSEIFDPAGYWNPERVRAARQAAGSAGREKP